MNTLNFLSLCDLRKGGGSLLLDDVVIDVEETATPTPTTDDVDDVDDVSPTNLP